MKTLFSIILALMAQVGHASIENRIRSLEIRVANLENGGGSVFFYHCACKTYGTEWQLHFVKTNASNGEETFIRILTAGREGTQQKRLKACREQEKHYTLCRASQN